MKIDIVVDLRPRLAPVRDQGYRLTCTAFATSDAHSCARDTEEYFSAEYVHSHGAAKLGSSIFGGLALRVVAETIASHGQPFEAQCPYVSLLPNGEPTLHPAGLVVPRYLQGFEMTEVPHVETICDFLDLGRSVVVVFRMNEQFHRPPTDGVIPGEPILIRDTNFHCVLAVGYGHLDGQIAVIVRNSWGTDWGFDGHVWLTKSYLAPRLRRLAVADPAQQARVDQ